MLTWLLACGSPTPPPTDAPPPVDAQLTRWCPADAAEVEARIDDLLPRLSLEEKVDLMAGDSVPERGVWPNDGLPDHGIGDLGMMDGPRGIHRGAGDGTTFPVGMARGATWDLELEREVGAAIGAEVRAVGARVLLAPTINLLWHPRWGRAQETYGETPVHVGAMGTAFVQGAQQHVLACAKHYAANNIEDTRYDVSVELEPRVLREVYLPHWRQVVTEGQVGAVMTAYNRVDGTYASENATLLGILLDDWAFPGFVTSDWVFGVHSTVPSLQAGLHLEMPNPVHFGEPLIQAVRDGSADEAAVDRAVRRLLRARFCYEDVGVEDRAVVASPSHVELARRTAAQSTVLLKNDGALPLTGTVAVVGPLADVENLGDDGSSATRSAEVVTIAEGLEAATGATLFDGFDPSLADFDAVVVVVGLTSDEEGEAVGNGGDRVGLALPDDHAALIHQVSALHDRVIVVLMGGGAITAPWEPAIEGLVMAWYPGMQGGHGVADVLTGAVNPSAHLPHTWPRSEADLQPFDNVSEHVAYGLLHGQTWLDANGTEAHWPLGFGLSYTSFTYGTPTIEEDDGGWTLQVPVTNSGPRDGADVVQVYGSVPGSAYPRPERLLVGFSRVEVAAGATVTATVRVDAAALDVWDDGWVREPGALLEVAPPDR